MRELLNKFKKHKLSILALLLAIILLYIINTYIYNGFLKFILQLLVIIGEVYIVKFNKKLNKK
ncbi:hypothetical protein NX821_003198 (plasmid) [Clostridium septicum]|uniref:hypothetical protein n=1 Tax=Clostridium septicum TaxID=1504 RepID=UPI00082B1F93|nr:hypothetical protein [Clostridium septicum]